jgi:hypothetical protein
LYLKTQNPLIQARIVDVRRLLAETVNAAGVAKEDEMLTRGPTFARARNATTTYVAGTVPETILAVNTAIVTADEQVHSMTIIEDRPRLQRVKYHGSNQKTCILTIGAIPRETDRMDGQVLISWKGSSLVASASFITLTKERNSRRLERENQVVNVWPTSPKAPARSSYVFVRLFQTSSD